MYLIHCSCSFSLACISPDEKAWKYTCEDKNFQDVCNEPEVCPFYEYYRIFVSEETVSTISLKFNSQWVRCYQAVHLVK